MNRKLVDLLEPVLDQYPLSDILNTIVKIAELRHNQLNSEHQDLVDIKLASQREESINKMENLFTQVAQLNPPPMVS